MSLEKPEYDKDFYAWAINSAKLIRAGDFSEVDLEHVAEEIESMGKSDRRELINRLAILLAHFLKWNYQPLLRGHSWKYTIKIQRLEIKRNLKESPSLKHELNNHLNEAYEEAIMLAAQETGFMENTFPEKCPYTLTQCFDDEFFPE